MGSRWRGILSLRDPAKSGRATPRESYAFVISLIPGLGTLLDLVNAWQGKDFITDEDLTKVDRAINTMASGLPNIPNSLVLGVVVSYLEELLEFLRRLGNSCVDPVIRKLEDLILLMKRKSNQGGGSGGRQGRGRGNEPDGGAGQPRPRPSGVPIQTGRHIIEPGTARILNERNGTCYHARDYGRALEEMKREYGQDADYHYHQIYDDGRVFDTNTRTWMENLFDYL